ncbi:MAG: sigma-70 family RNA polymerase sigma factor [Planctomycetota bacterium]|jgi:RNA polymerase sigma-70 factor (ECF subfamily)|nr:sigma-70 family RNA polymerase sigma factor [Planctomycetota bacterium]
MPLPNDQKPPAAKVAPEQLEELFQVYGSKIYGLALRCGLAPKEAEDGVQEVFLKVQRRISTFRGEAALSTWLYQVALNTLRDHRRKVVRQTRATSMSLVSDQPADPTFSGDTATPVEEASISERRQMVRDALDRLPPNFREVLILRELEGMSYRDVARVLKVKQGTVESRIFRARERLGAELKRMGVN